MINYASKYEKQLAQEFTQKSVVDGAVGNDYEFTGVKNIKVYTAVSQPLNDYKRTGQNRYGEPTEVQDTVQDMEVKKDRSFSLTIDKAPLLFRRHTIILVSLNLQQSHHIG